ncbi:carbohydrate-binding protein [Massilia sp. TSP1-1-2]|uniref:carbohydrate-binding protein n=1 Tax=Massilia sp. TSP1-1-2 TaxID=2804649 RepID=UPI003CF31863
MHSQITMRAPGALRLLLGLGLALAGATSAAQTALPGTLQAESYTSMAGVALEATGDAGGGSDVGWIDANDYMTYSVNPSSAGWYTVQYRVASAGTTGQIVLSQNSLDISSVTGVPNTGGWRTWTTIASRIYLSAGAQNLTVFAKGGGFNLNWIGFTREASTAALPAIRQSGKYWVDASGARVNLRGVNLGNWLAMEMWMMNSSIANSGGAIADQCTLESTLASRFGVTEKERLMNVWRDSYITARDFDLIKAMGMNVVRVPFLYDVVENKNAPYTLRADAWKYLDFAVNEAEKRGMYVILDLHGAVGGAAAASEQHDGCVGPAEMWTNQTYRDRTKWVWDMVASHYCGRTAVAAYDLLNEPWGTDATTLANFGYELFDTVRAKDPEHMIILPGHNSGIDAYGNPNARGKSNVAFWMHFYPGLWGWNEVSGPAAQANMYADWLQCGTGDAREVCAWNTKLTALSTPFLVGEFQPWTLLGNYGAQMTRHTHDIFNMLGWGGTAWSYKTTSQAGWNGGGWNWGMVTNSTAGAYGNLNVSTASAAAIEAYFRGFGTQALVKNEAMATWMNWKPTVGTRIEAEMFNNHVGMRVETTTDTGGGFNVGYTDNNDWMTYPINVPVGGAHTVQFRVASGFTGGQLVLSKNGADLALINVPNTGGFQAWTTVSATVQLTAGQQDLAIYSRVGGWNLNWWQLNKQ